VAAWLPCTEVEGPGRRAALWVQCCDKRCPGCCNPNFLPFATRKLRPARQIAADLADAAKNFQIEGVTFLGGEPMLQAVGLISVAEQASQLGLSVMVFTGYTVDELEALRLPGVSALLALTDVLVDGPYVARQPDRARRWIGSTNQRVHYLSKRYDSRIECLPDWGRDLEVRFGLDASLQVNGWPTRIVRPREGA
jgi:anaerobic ribonucleoside-triphosphate reductase activating protein